MLASSSGSLRLIVHHKAGLAYWVPLAYVQRVRTVPHVVGENHWTWFGGVYNDPKDQFPNLAVDPEAVCWVDIADLFNDSNYRAYAAVRLTVTSGADRDAFIRRIA